MNLFEAHFVAPELGRVPAALANERPDVVCDEEAITESLKRAGFLQTDSIGVPLPGAEERLPARPISQSILVENERVERQEESSQLEELHKELKRVSGDRDFHRWHAELLQGQLKQRTTEMPAARRNWWRLW